MRPLQQVSAAEQVAAHLRQEIFHGTWSTRLPGVHALAAELGSNHHTVLAALRLLEQERLLTPQGHGRARRIRLPRSQKAHRPLRVAILDYEKELPETIEGYTVELKHLLMEAGYTVFSARYTLLELDMNVQRVARLVQRTPADAWVLGAASREVLEWFIAQGIPAFAWYGRRQGLPIAGVGPKKLEAAVAATRRLIELGHRRIVLLVRKERRMPQPGQQERAFLDELAAHGIRPGPYNLPEWKESVEGFHARLEALFRVTPPTALIVDEAPFFFATMQFLMVRRLRVPQDVSLVCTDNDRVFAWSKPAVAHIHWETGPVVRRIVRWVKNVSCGRRDVRQTMTPAKFVEGGTIGPPPVQAA